MSLPIEQIQNTQATLIKMRDYFDNMQNKSPYEVQLMEEIKSLIHEANAYEQETRHPDSLHNPS